MPKKSQSMLGLRNSAYELLPLSLKIHWLKQVRVVYSPQRSASNAQKQQTDCDFDGSVVTLIKTTKSIHGRTLCLASFSLTLPDH